MLVAAIVARPRHFLEQVAHPALGAEADVGAACYPRGGIVEGRGSVDLKDFIKETITSITKAAVELQADLDDDGIVINPPRAKDYREATPDVFDPEDSDFRFRQIEKVSFDVALTASEESSAKGGGGLKVAVFSMGANAGGEVAERATAERVSRVVFSISIALPPSKHEEANRKR